MDAYPLSHLDKLRHSAVTGLVFLQVGWNTGCCLFVHAFHEGLDISYNAAWATVFYVHGGRTHDILTSSFSLLSFSCSDAQSLAHYSMRWQLWLDDQVDLPVYFSVPWKERLLNEWIWSPSSRLREAREVGVYCKVAKALLLVQKSKTIFSFSPWLLPNNNAHIYKIIRLWQSSTMNL